MRQLGLSPSECAFIMGVSTISSSLARTIIGIIADKFRRHIQTLIVCCFLAGVCHVGLLFVPRQTVGNHELINPDPFKTLHVRCDHSLPDGDLLLCEMPSEVTADNSTLMSLSPMISFQKDAVLFDDNCSYNPMQCRVSCCGDERSTFNSSETVGNVSKLDVKSDQICERTFVLKLGVTAQNVSDRSTDSYTTSQGCGVFRLKTDDVVNERLKSSDLCDHIKKYNCSSVCTRLTNESRSDNQFTHFGKTFWIFFGLSLAGSCFLIPIMSLIDGLVYAKLGENRTKFGQQRFWGSVSFGLFGVLSGILMDVLQTDAADKNFTYSFLLFFAFLLATSFFVCLIHASVEVITGNLMSNILRILRSLDLNLLMLTALVSGVICGAQETFQFWFLQSIGGPQMLMGLALLIQCSAETVLMIFSGRIINKMGTNFCFCLTFLAYGVRFALYSFLVNPWCVLAIEPVHSICFGLFYPAMTIRASELTPTGMHASVQGLLGTLYMNIGKLTGSTQFLILFCSDVGLVLICFPFAIMITMYLS
jgi:hypothetical protein